MAEYAVDFDHFDFDQIHRLLDLNCSPVNVSMINFTKCTFKFNENINMYIKKN